MNAINYRPAQATDLESIAQMIVEQNRHPDTHCIHSDNAEDAPGTLREMQRLHAEGGLRFVVATGGDQLLGALGCELDEELGRAWLRGPFVSATEPDWRSLSSTLFQELLDSLPASIHIFDGFLNIANERGNQFYQERGFKQLRLVHVYQAASLVEPSTALEPCDPLLPTQTQSFIELHESVFPGTYATGQRILDKLDDSHRVFTLSQGSQLLGYVYVTFDEESGEGSIEFIGVRETERGKNLGRRLLMAALRGLFEEKKAPLVMLVVNDNLTNARSLYESAGFQLKYTGVHSRKGGTS